MGKRFEVECGWCGRKHTVKTLAKSLLCCSVRTGVRGLIVEVEDPETGARWFAVTNGTHVRVYVKEARGG